MPLNKISLDAILGLTTQRDDTSGINSPQWSSMSAWATENTSSGSTNPNTLLDCENIFISRNKQAAARTAFVEVWDFTSTYGADATFFTVGLYAIPNSSASSDSLQIGWINNTQANIANFSNITDQTMTSTKYIIDNVQSNNFTSYEGLTVDFSWDTAVDDGFPIKSFNLARFNSSYSNIYVFSSNGVFRTINPYISDVTLAGDNFNYYKRVILPLVLSLSGSLNSSPAASSTWFPSGSLVDIKIVVTEQLTATQVYQGKPSRTLTIINTGPLTSILVTFAVDNTNLLLNAAGISIYRTISYLPKTTPPSEFYKCYEAPLSAATTTVSNVSTFSNIELILNDTSIKGFQIIYTSLNAESAAAESAESAAPPTARDVVQYNNFTVYGNVMCPPFAPLTMTALPNTDGADQLTVGATTVNLTYTPNSVVSPADTGVIDAVTGTFTGVANNPNSGTPTGSNGYHLVLRPQDPNAPASTANTFSVPYPAIAQSLTIVTGTGSTQNIQIVPGTGTIFDITKFPATGIVAVVQSTSTGYVVALFSYQSYAQVPASGWYLFSNCLAYGAAFSSATWGMTGLQANGAYVLFPLLGTNITGLSTYAIGSTASGFSSHTGFSLQPTYNQLQPFNPVFVGTITALNQVTPATLWDPILGTINFLGNFALQAAQLLDQCVRNLCDSYNSARLLEDPYAVYNDSATAPVGQIRFESNFSGYNRASTYASNPLYTNGNGYYDAIQASVQRQTGHAGSVTVQFAEPISGTLSNIMQQSVQTIAGLTVSKFNKPEEIPIGQNLTPTIVGNPLNPIIKLINQYNQLLVFKQNEGTYRLDIQTTGANGVLPKFNILSLIDNTAWLLLPESVQVFEGTTIFFSNKAFVSISSTGQVIEISSMIATELLDAYTTILANNAMDSVRSWIIAQQRLYCCYFPNINSDNTSETYVFCFSTGQWTKWSGEIQDAVVSATGYLSLTENIYEYLQVVSDSNDINSKQIDTSNKYWTVLRQANFQNPSITQIEDIISLATFSLSIIVGESNIEIQISNFNSTNIYGNIYDILMLFKNRTIWYLSETFGYLQVVLNKTVPNVSINLLLVDNTYNKNPIFIPNFSVSSDDLIQTTVNTAIFFNRFFIALPRGSTLSHFNEVQMYTQDGIEYSNLAIGFNAQGQVPEYVYLNDGITRVVTSNGNFVILNNSTYDLFSPYYILAASQYVFRVLIPLNAGRGRFIQIAILHDTPNEVFKLNSLVYIYRDTQSTKIKAHSTA